MVLGHQLAMGLRLPYRSMHRRTNSALAGHGVTADQFVVLGLLYQEDGITQQELCRRASSDPNTVRAMLVLLEKNRLVRRRPHRTDRRALAVSLTARGRATYDSLLVEVEPLQKILEAVLDEEEARIVVHALRRIDGVMTT